MELRKAQILESAGYHKWRLVLHRFLILKLYIPEISCPRLWLRFDRRPVPGLGFVLGAGVTPANDQVSLSLVELSVSPKCETSGLERALSC